MSTTRIFCKHIEPIWQKKTLGQPEKQVDIWKVSVQDYNLIPENILSKDELLKAARFLHSKDRASFVSRRAALRILLSRYTDISPSRIEFIAGKNKKPELRSELNTIRFNVSHSSELILIAISDTEIGVDIERIEPSFNYSDILRHSFSEQEINHIKQAADSRDFFFRLWTRKEALAKASSKGLDDELRNIPCLDGWHNVNEELIRLSGSWQLQSFNIDHEYIASIACPAEKGLNYLYFEF
ncbi:MAG TPA: 4'-phosphopantetheinyl transferase superfamily protein [Daejeonella sp.]|uniref:4'-phosphopantetheinyl transferase family protein n=1 Tax=Daejeonella sp. TaxID=2805397 RepID=UPI00269CEE11|nr:4'-phosphopantetheinyl transferase superfamily protein [Daejeonella sp.]HQS50272.1 4'-phosphopantetheinyl transferase superfamily protein [Daejeonella sp.]HQT23444.1 4'-phosphopantetheinyl transferase superfamily protein [Daejeonella sp.]HQT58321.1 4'-phosphopantetheinyl transferase superfamily protein [Daejeonella sp.]